MASLKFPQKSIFWTNFLNILILLILHIFPSEMAITIKEGACGTIDTDAGKTLTLLEEVALDPVEFKKIHVKKMKNSLIKPSKNCAISVCGFSSWMNAQRMGYYKDCQEFRESIRTENGIYNSNYNTSAVMCGCRNPDDEECRAMNCQARDSNIVWSNQSCAVLYQEDNCQNCYLQPIYLENGQNFTKTYKNHFISIIVRDNCLLTQDMSAISKTKEYDGRDGGLALDKFKVDSSFLSDPETYHCACADDIPTTTTTTTNTVGPIDPGPNPAITTKPSNHAKDIGTPGKLYLIIGGVVLALGATISAFFGYRIWKRRRNATNPHGTDDFKTVLIEFNEICQAKNIIPRSAINISKKNLGKPLGNGRFGIVYKGSIKHESDGLFEKVAVKRINWSGSPKCVKRSFFREIRTFQNIGSGSPFIVAFIGACCDTDGLFLVTEYCEGGSLADHLFNKLRPEIFPEAVPNLEMIEEDDDYFKTDEQAEQLFMDKMKHPKLNSNDLSKLLLWCEQIAGGMEYLGLKGIFHLDLATRNVLLKNGNVKICDYGLSKEFCANSIITGDFPLNSFAPELTRETGMLQISGHVDVWAFGCTIWEIFTLQDQLYGHVEEKGILKHQEVKRLLSVEWRHPKPVLAPDSVYEIMMKCWDQIPEKRPDFSYLRMYFQALRAGDNEDESSDDGGSELKTVN